MTNRPEPMDCKYERDEKACINCEFNTKGETSHPGGVREGGMVETWLCELGYFEDDF